MQMPRQLRRGGGIMEVAPRQGALLGGLKKAVKGVAKGISGILKSDVGKLGLLAAGGFGLAGKGPLAGLLGADSFLRSTALPAAQSFFGGEKTLGKTLGVMAGGTVLGGVLGALSPEEQEEVSTGRNIEALRGKLTTAYQNLGYDESEIPALVDNDLSEYTSGAGGYAEGGRIGYSDGTEFEKYLEGREKFNKEQNVEQLYKEFLENKRRQKVAEQKTMAANGGRIGYNDGTNLKKDFLIKKGYGDMVKNMSVIEIDQLFNSVKGTTTAANTYREPAYMGGRMGYAMGTDQIVDQASGIMGLPQNINKAGVKELDLRESGGFIPPVGIKEKADDIPAMLSNNEFVFTADAVRGMGDGNVNKGAQRMYDMMKKLEKGGRV
jgi:hypothetical protein